MKKSILISVLCFVMMTGSLMAQIKVNSQGQVGINNTTPSYQLDISGNVRMALSGNNITFNGYSLLSSSSVDLGTSANRWYHLYAATAYYFYAPVIDSDEKIKLNITNLPLIKDQLKLLRPVTYKLKADIQGIRDDSDLNSLQYGFVAQELQKVFPDMVVTREDGMLGIRYTELIPVLVQAIKEQQEEIDALTKRISDLENVGK